MKNSPNNIGHNHISPFKVGIAGATGYTGLELCRLLLRHPQVRIEKLFGNRSAGQHFGDIYPHLSQLADFPLLTLNPEEATDLDVLFLALPHGQTHEIMHSLRGLKCKIVDLSADFRLPKAELFNQWYTTQHKNPEFLKEAVYGMPELFREKIRQAWLCANPGCYPTSVILGLYPMAANGLIHSPVIIDAKSGVSGAGKSLKETSLFCEAANSISAYGTGKHRHTPEMETYLGTPVLFSPHLVPMNRGILATMYVENRQKLKQEDIAAVYNSHYKEEPFIKLLPDLARPSTQLVSGSNNCVISFKVFSHSIVIFSMIDNLLKGAAGQAIQNMNLMLGLPETTALESPALYL